MEKIFNVVQDCREMFEEEIIETILNNRGIKDKESFLNPSADDILPLDSMYRIEEAGDAILWALTNKYKILVHADVDNDGASAAAIMIGYLRDIGADVSWTINDNKEHGVTDKLINKLKENKPDLLIIVDSLDEDIENYKFIHEMGIKTIVLDHHIVSNEIPYDDYVILVSSNRKYGNPNLSGAGVVWKFTKYIDEYLLGSFDSDKYIDLAMSGIIGDMVDVSEQSKENRAIIDIGLKNINNLALKRIGGSFDFNSSTISFGVSPRVNACNRMNRNELSVSTLISNDDSEVRKLIKELDKCKEEQNKLVESLMDDAIKQAEEQSDRKYLFIVVDVKSNVNGLLANILMNKYGKPTIVAREEFGTYSGSARGCGVDSFKELCEQTECCQCAGHENAFGISIRYDLIESFRNILEGLLEDVTFVSKYYIDAIIDQYDVTDTFIDEIKKIDRISGEGFKPITFEITLDDFEISEMSKGKHLVLKTNNMWFIKWNFKGDREELEDALLMDEKVTCIGTLTSGFIGRNYHRQMIMEDFVIN